MSLSSIFLRSLLLSKRTIRSYSSTVKWQRSMRMRLHHPYYYDATHPELTLLKMATTTTFHTSSLRMISSSQGKKKKAKEMYPRLDLTFNNAKEAYRSKGNGELLRALMVFQSLAFSFLAEHQMTIMNFWKRLLGQKIFEKLMKLSYFGHFVAGEDQVDIAPKIQRMRSYGVSAILDYSAEEDMPEKPHDTEKKEVKLINHAHDNHHDAAKMKKYKDDKITATERKRRAVSRTYAYYNEAACDKNMEIFLDSIKAVASTKGSGKGFAAIKATAICKPELLLRISEAIERVRAFVEHLTGAYGPVHSQNITVDKLKKRFAKASEKMPELEAWMNSIETDSNGIINILPWTALLSAKKSVRDALVMPNPLTKEMEKLVPINDAEVAAFKNALNRFHTVFKEAAEAHVSVLVDAEQTYFQPAISRVTMEMMHVYNKDKAIVCNTYQCYLKNAYNELIGDLNQSERQDFYFGAKLVRGAYMEQEAQRAETMGYENPINPSFEATTEMYEDCMDECLYRIKELKQAGQLGRIRIMAATHNEDTVRFVIGKMQEYGINRDDGVICFGQLYGMCDHVSFPLGQSGYEVYKYVPYGPISKVLPYLSRRAQENKGFVAKTGKERQLMRQELWRRLKNRELNYKPPM